MAFSETELRKAFRTAWELVSGLPPDISYHNIRFTPPDHANTVGPIPVWVGEMSTILSERKTSTGFIEATGEYLLIVRTPKGRPTERADDLAQALVETLKPGQSLTTDCITVILERSERRPYREDPANPTWISKTVAVRWRVFSPV